MQIWAGAYCVPLITFICYKHRFRGAPSSGASHKLSLLHKRWLSLILALFIQICSRIRCLCKTFSVCFYINTVEYEIKWLGLFIYATSCWCRRKRYVFLIFCQKISMLRHSVASQTDDFFIFCYCQKEKNCWKLKYDIKTCLNVLML